MDIGTVVNIIIEEKDNTCIVINKKTYADLHHEWTGEHLFLAVFNGYLGLHRGSRLSYIYFPTKAKWGFIMCCEVMCGDSRMWVHELILELWGRA